MNINPFVRDRVRDTDSVFTCPHCSADLGYKPAVSVILLRTPVMRNGKPHSVVTGERFECSVCGAHFCVGPRGVFIRQGLEMPRNATRVPPPEEEDDSRPTIPPPITRSFA